MNIGELISKASDQLQGVSDSPRLDAEVLLCHVLKKNRAYLIGWSDHALTDDQLEAFESLLQQRLDGQPVAHLTGEREFWSLNLQVTKDTLIPRPETELLVEQILEHYPDNSDIKLADLGTGSGAIALAIASERPHWQIIASDQSEAALKIAQQNATALSLNNIEFRQGSWFEPIANETFDIIASNPPYIRAADPHLQQGDLRFEPDSALSSGADGLDDIRIIVSQAAQYLKPGGLLIIEHGYDQQEEILGIFHKNNFQNTHQARDIANNPRTTCGIKAP